MLQYFTNKVSLSLAVAAIIQFGNQVLPLLPTPWANLLTAIFGLYAFYKTPQLVAGARRAGTYL